MGVNHTWGSNRETNKNAFWEVWVSSPVKSVFVLLFFFLFLLNVECKYKYLQSLLSHLSAEGVNFPCAH